MTNAPENLRDAVREVLLTEWDDSNGFPGRHDALIDRLIDVIRSSSDESPIVKFLHEREKESMCFPSLGTARLRPVARKLLRLLEMNH